jgi:PIN domain nuclease of toxin-antitoxin system
MGRRPVTLLLDTHVLIWLVEGLDQLRPASRRAIDAAARADGVAVSAISFWEVAMLASRGRISLKSPIPGWRAQVLDLPGVREAPVTGAAGVEAVLLPGRLHDDPADRLLVATARLFGMRLATQDRRLLRYGAAGHVATLKV